MILEKQLRIFFSILQINHKPITDMADTTDVDWSFRMEGNLNGKKPDYNSMDLEYETIYAYLTMGWRTPQNDDERELAREIKKIRKEGYTVDIPSNGI